MTVEIQVDDAAIKNKEFTYHEDIPWAIFEGNYKSKIDWVGELMRGRASAVARTEEDVAANTSLNGSPMHRRQHTKVYSAPTPWSKSTSPIESKQKT